MFQTFGGGILQKTFKEGLAVTSLLIIVNSPIQRRPGQQARGIDRGQR
jgi:hypothetical protein